MIRNYLISCLLTGIILVSGCAGTTDKPVPSASKPASSLTAAQVSNLVWSRLQEDLPGCKKTQLDPATRKATAKGNGAWDFEVAGAGNETVQLPFERYQEIVTNRWFEEEKVKVTSYKLKLTAVFYENLNILDGVRVEKLDVVTETKIISRKPIPAPVAEQLTVEWIRAQYGGQVYELEGSVKNTGTITLSRVRAEFSIYDSNYVNTENKTFDLKPDVIEIGQTGYFKYTFDNVVDLRYFKYRFILPSGREIPHTEEAAAKANG